MNTLAKIVIPVLILVGLFLCWRNDNLSSQLNMEKERHETTAKDLRTALEESATWSAVHDVTLQSAEAHRQNTEACLAREARAQAAAAEREVIMRKAQPRLKTPKETVLDHETRARIVDRLNRAL